MEAKEDLKSFTALVAAVRGEIEAGRAGLERETLYRKTRVMWKIGKAIQAHILANQDKAGYGDSVFDKLAEALAMGKRVLYRTVQFYKAYPEIVSPETQLPWSHYVILLSVKDPVKRGEYERAVLKEKLGKRQLLELIKREQPPAPAAADAGSSDGPRVLRGRPGVYRLMQMDGRLHLDCGFYSYLEREELAGITDTGSYIEYDGGKHRLIKADKFRLYTFKAKIKEVIDGDTGRQ